jgi:branched-chain amino acid transport system ATP-binding protein
MGGHTRGASLEIESVSRRFGGLEALSDVRFRVEPGEFVSIIGPNGAGKTTLFNIVTGFDRADAGRVSLDGADISRLEPERLAELHVARTFQHGRVFGNLSVRENVLIGAHGRLSAVKPKTPVLGALGELALALWRPAAVRAEEAALRAEVDQLLARFGERLTPRADHPAYSLSYANRRRVEIARALASRPRLLLLDEPTAGMNPTETAEMQALIAELKTTGVTIVLIEHKLDMVLALSDRVVALDEGKVVAVGTAKEVRNDARVIEAYLGAAGKNEISDLREAAE